MLFHAFRIWRDEDTCQEFGGKVSFRLDLVHMIEEYGYKGAFDPYKQYPGEKCRVIVEGRPLILLESYQKLLTAWIGCQAQRSVRLLN